MNLFRKNKKSKEIHNDIKYTTDPNNQNQEKILVTSNSDDDIIKKLLEQDLRDDPFFKRGKVKWNGTPAFATERLGDYGIVSYRIFGYENKVIIDGIYKSSDSEYTNDVMKNIMLGRHLNSLNDKAIEEYFETLKYIEKIR